MNYGLAAIYGQLDRRKCPTAALEMMLKLTLSYESKPPRFSRKLISSEKVVQYFAEGLRKAWLKISDEKG